MSKFIKVTFSDSIDMQTNQDGFIDLEKIVAVSVRPVVVDPSKKCMEVMLPRETYTVDDKSCAKILAYLNSNSYDQNLLE
jgi:hypothetical protein